MTRQPAATTPEWGYLLQEPPYPQAPGGSRLDIALLGQPSGRHFDPYKAEFPVVTHYSHGVGEHYSLGQLVVTHPWEGRPRHRVVAGVVRAWNHKDEEVSWFTFGGTLELEHHPGYTLARLTSPAPILEVGPEEEMVLLLAQEAEELLAQRKAAHLEDHLERLAQRLAQADPWVLYCAVLQALTAKFARLPKEPVEERFLAFLHRQMQQLREADRCPHSLPTLEDLL